jgi:hypothetical protein
MRAYPYRPEDRLADALLHGSLLGAADFASTHDTSV